MVVGVKTGVDLHWHSLTEYKSLSNKQKDELREWQESKDGKEATKEAKAKFFRDKKRRKGSNKNGILAKKKAKIASLEKKLAKCDTIIANSEKETQISAALKSLSNCTGKTNNDSHQSAVCTIMNIVAHEATTKKKEM